MKKIILPKMEEEQYEEKDEEKNGESSEEFNQGMFSGEEENEID